MNTNGSDKRVILRGLGSPYGLTTFCFPNNEPKTTVTTGMVLWATNTLADNTQHFVNQSDIDIVTGMLSTTDL